MRLGFLIDHDRCIGCHACTVACKAENEVPVGNFRTWVKYLEAGSYPDVRRHFAVLRCNHCDDAPCVTICPVGALQKRADGVVDLDRDACIACRACMQACPYDAIAFNEDTHAVEKCHFCAHRLERGLEPACVIVCPERAIVMGDLDDPRSTIAQMLEQSETLVRRPEQGTGPNVHYKGVHPALLTPGEAGEESMYLWSDKPPSRRLERPVSLPVLKDTRVVLDVGHEVEWGWPVAMYLLTKGIAAGAAMLAPAGAWLGLGGDAGRLGPEIIALVFTLLTVVLLIEDLGKPWAFYRLLTRPNWRSWLVRGGVILGIFGAGLSLAIALRLLAMDALADAMRWINAPLGVACAGYTAFLFAQCKGRDLWESRLLLPHLIVQAGFLGGLALGPFQTAGGPGLGALVAICAMLHGVLAVLERSGRHATSNARQAAAYLAHLRVGPVRAFDASLALVALSAVLIFLSPAGALVAGMIGMYLYEWAFVRAGQLPPLS